MASFKDMSVREKCVKVCSQQKVPLSNLIKTVAFVMMSAPANNAYVDRFFSLTLCYQHKEQNQCGEDLVKVETQVKMNYGLSCKDFYVFQNNEILGAVVICKTVPNGTKGWNNDDSLCHIQ
jgi:hypothetical protein